MNRIGTAGLALLLVGSLLSPAGATGVAGADEAFTSDNMRFVTNLEFEKRPDLGSSSRLATDTDFFSYTFNEEVDGVEVTEERDFAFVGTYVNGLQVVDVTDPEAPEVVAVYECAIAQSDVFVFERADLDRVFLAYTSDVIASQTNVSSRCHTDNEVTPGQYGTFLVDITDPYDPQSVSFVAFPRGTHQVTINPDGTHIYSSPAALVTTQTGQIDLVDITDPWDPEVLPPLELGSGLDSHDMAFSADGDRVYSAALTHTLIIDTSDPSNPEVIGRVLDPAINIHHEAQVVSTDDPLLGERTFLLIGDEIAGAAGNGVCPGGGIHVYDITDELERTPVKVGAFFPPEAGATPGAPRGEGGTIRCTAHVMQVHPEEGIIIAAWYAAGVRILDVSGLAGISAGVDAEVGSLGAGITEIGYGHMPDSDTWAAKTNRIAEDGSFYIFGIDTYRELDVWHFSPDGHDLAGEARGEWVSPQDALQRSLAAPGSSPLLGTSCRLQ